MAAARFFPADKLLLSIANFLCALGVLVLYSTDLIKGTNYGLQQAMFYGVGIVVMLICILLVRYIRYWRVFIYIIGVSALVLISLPLIFGTEVYGATNWIIISGISLQPSEIVKLALLLVLSYFMSRRRFLSWLFFAVFCMGVLMFQKDLGTALIYYATTLFLYYASTGNLWVTGVGILGGGASAVYGYYQFAHVKRRIAVWLNPWLDYEKYRIPDRPDSDGYRIWRFIRRRAWSRLSNDHPCVSYRCDFCRDLRTVWYHIWHTASAHVRHPYPARARSSPAMPGEAFTGLLAMGATVMLGLQTFVIIGGVLKLIPLTGVTMPFVSHGGTSLVSCMGLIGLLQGVATVNQDDLTYDYQVTHNRVDEEALPFASLDE